MLASAHTTPHNFRTSYIHASPPSASSLEDRLAQGSLRSVAPKEHVFVEGDARTDVYKIESGAVCVYKTMADGRRQILSFAFAGDVIGLGTVGKHPFSAQATKPTRIRCMSAASLHQIALQDGRFGLKLYEAVSEELAASRELLVTVGQRSAAERLASFLLALSRRNDRKGLDPNVIELPMTRSDIGDFLGLTIETVSRTFTKFRTGGLIDLKQANTVHLFGRDQLEALAEGEDSDCF